MDFQGEFEHSVDDKGRVIMPTKFRKDLGEKFFLTKGIDNCIFVYTREEFQDIWTKINSQPQFDPNTIKLQRRFTPTETSVDSQGRVALPQKLRKHAGIAENSTVTIVGLGNRVEIWDNDAWEAYSDSIDEGQIGFAAREIGLG